MWVCNVLLKVKNLLGCLHLLRVFFSLLRKRGVESKCFRFPPFFALPFDSLKKQVKTSVCPEGSKAKREETTKEFCYFEKLAVVFLFIFAPASSFFPSYVTVW